MTFVKIVGGSMDSQDKSIIDVIDKIARHELTAKDGLEIIRTIRKNATVHSAADAGALFCNTSWVEADIGERTWKEGGALIFIRNQCRIADDIQGKLHDAGISVIEVKSGASYSRLGDAAYELNLQEEGDLRKLLEELKNDGIGVRTVLYCMSASEISGQDQEADAGVSATFYPLYHMIRGLMLSEVDSDINILCICECDDLTHTPPLFDALSGFGRSVHLEHQKFKFKFAVISSQALSEQAAGRLCAEALSWRTPVSEIRWEGETRFERVLKEFDISTAVGGDLPFREGGVYVITGGLGGLGSIFARHLSKTYKARLVLSDMRDADGYVEERMRELGVAVGDAIYVKCDVTIRDEVRSLLQAGRERFGGLDGIIHVAGVLKDALIGGKTLQNVESVIRPKVNGTINLDAESRDDDLGLFILFSSIAGVTGNIGQTDYAFANRFLDHFSKQREEMRKAGARRGRTLSIAWPLWEAGGMHVDEETVKWMRQTLGIVPLPVDEGLELFERVANSSVGQVAVLFGDERKIREMLLSAGNRASAAEATESARVGEASDELYGKVCREMMELVSEILKIRENDVDIEADMSEYGFDSISITALANRLNAKYDTGLLPAVFFEHGSIDSMVRYLVSEYAEKLRAHHNLSRAAQDIVEERDIGSKGEDRKRVRRTSVRELKTGMRTGALESVAVVGMSGVFPQSSDLNDFWSHLENCDDLITEIPPDRWDWRSCYGDQLKEANKTRAKWGGFMKGVAEFDAAFFNISPYEAELMDPQQRIFMEVVWKTIEDAGYRTSSLSGSRTGLFVGVSTNDYSELLQKSGVSVAAHTSTGIAHSVLANRISYLLDIHGPSEPIDTACSSSLIAIHRAVRAIHDGDCDMAIAGGVSVILTPTAHISFSKAGMLSEDGRCRTFDKRANGYVRGEGVGAVFLKPLSKAVRDGDHIYGIIRASGENHGGHVSSLTVPNPVAQAQLLDEVYTRAGIEPWRIGYVECHGTGTALGDPVEVNGLKRAFAAMYGRCGKEFSGNPYCGLGTVKTNIGHLEAAAGIAGFIKVLLSLQHKELPGVVHYHELNPYIDLNGSPFYIVDRTMAWQRLKDDRGEELPRIAGVSSFGFGGANAHVVIEEYLEAEGLQGRHRKRKERPEIILFSARDRERLNKYAGDVLAGLEAADQLDGVRDIERMAYTLQVGRDVMGERLAFVVRDAEELKDNLRGYLEGKEGIEGLHTGNAKAVTDREAAVWRSEGDRNYIRDLFERGNMNKLAALWASGSEIDWESFYADDSDRPRRLSLPTYPFRRDRYWIPDTGDATGTSAERICRLHELIDSNESTLEEQCYLKVLNGNEYYLRDHVVGGSRVLPGVVYLEMARVAGDLAGNGLRVHRISDVVWLQPVVIEGGNAEAYVSLYPDDDVVEYKVTSGRGNGSQRVVNSQGRIWFGEADDEVKAERIDLEAIRSRCGEVLDKESCYRIFMERGLEYGPNFQGMNELRHGDTEALAELELPKELMGNFGDYVLHPSLMDAALQSVMGVIGDAGEGTYVPFSLGEVRIVRPMETKCYSYVRAQDGGKGAMRRFDIDIVNESGEVLVRLMNFAMRAYNKQMTKGAQAESAGKQVEEVVYLVEEWVEENTAGKLEPLSGTVLCLGDYEAIRDDLEGMLGEQVRAIRVKKGDACRQIDAGCFEVRAGDEGDFAELINQLRAKDIHPDKIVFVWGGDAFGEGMEEVGRWLEDGIYSLFGLTRALMEGKPEGEVRVMCVNRGEGVNPLISAMIGFARSANLENSKFKYKIVTPGSEVTADALVGRMSEELSRWGEAGVLEVKCEGGKRYVRKLREIGDKGLEESKSVLKQGGVYVITGGIGGLGAIFARYLSRKYKARLVLTDVRELDGKGEDLIDEISVLGGEAHYVRCDVTKREDVRNLVRKGKERFGRVDGIIHAAGVLRDSFITKKTREEMDLVLGAKIYGAINLDAESRGDDLDFFATFASIAGVIGNAGQSDYAYANRFLDNFAEWREGLRMEGMLRGKTFSIDWPLWEEGGMMVADEVKKWIKQAMGLTVLKTEDGLHAFDTGLRGVEAHMAVLYGDVSKIRKSIEGEKGRKPEAPAGDSEASGQGDALLFDKLHQDIVELVSGILKIKEADVDADVDMSEYGFDSITITEFANRINAKFDISLMPAVFFEHHTIDSMLRYLLDEYAVVMSDYYKVAKGSIAPGVIEREKSAAVRRSGSRFRTAGPVEARASAVADSIAVVGMSGVFPQSSDLNEFWHHLDACDDLITEIPPDRWDWRKYYGDTLTEENRTRAKWGGFMKEVDKFDAPFFSISPFEAGLMDPQQRIFLEVVWKSIEDAGYRAKSLSGTKTGLFAGVCSIDYKEILQNSGVNINAYMPTGLAHSVLANRISYLLNLRGPSEPIDTACSSSLIAIHRAVRSIQDGDCEMAIAGGVNVILTPTLHIAFSKAGMLSEDGRCKTFDRRADGYVRGEGAGAVFLKSLSKAISDGDHIYGVIRATGENHGGHVNSLTVPNPVAQAELLVDVYRRAGIEPSRIGYIECHGTGTSLGDPVEINGLKRAFAELYRRSGKEFSGEPYCGLGTVKTNIGHLEASAGIAGFIKALLSMHHSRLPGVVNFTELNPQIEISGSPFYIVETSRSWERARDESGREVPRVMGVSSFGFGGANAHVVVEEYTGKNRAGVTSRQGGDAPEVILLSAKDKDRLKAYAEELVSYIETAGTEGSIDLSDVAYTLQVGRDPFEERLAAVVMNSDELKEKLRMYLAGEENIDGFHFGNIRSIKDKDILIDEGEEEKEFIRQLFSKGKLNRLAALWVNGSEIDWEEFYAGREERPNRISLPTYPFSRKHYWPEGQKREPELIQRREISSVSAEELSEASRMDFDGIVRAIIKIVAHRTTHYIGSITQSTVLNELGVDSVAMLEIAGDIVSMFPVLQSRGSDLLKSFENNKIEDMARFVYENKNSRPPPDRMEINEEELNELNVKQKKDRRNLLCDAVRIASATPLSIEGRLIVDEAHPFFFDHPLDHISGMQLVESMNQICSLGCMLEVWPDSDKDAYLMESRCTFRNFCKKTEPAFVSCVKETKDNAVYYTSKIVQSDKIVSTGTMAYARIGRMQSRSDKMSNADNKIVPCPRDIVNKANAENVVISGVEETDMGPGCWLLSLTDHPYFSDNTSELLSGLHLLEACRQSLRAIEYYLRSKGDHAASFNQENKMALLRDVEMSLKRPLGRSESIFIKSNDPITTRVGDNVLIKYRASILADRIEVGTSSISAMILDKDTYQGWRNDGTDAALKMKE